MAHGVSCNCHTVEEAVLPVRLVGPLPWLLPPLLALLPALTLAGLAALALVVLGQLARVSLVLLKLAAGLWSRRLGRGRLFGLEVGV
jgi:hypothetical protein